MIKKVAPYNPNIWKEMAEWISKVSPAVAVGMYSLKPEEND